MADRRYPTNHDSGPAPELIGTRVPHLRFASIAIRIAAVQIDATRIRMKKRPIFSIS
jgi:hypothetical protein